MEMETEMGTVTAMLPHPLNKKAIVITSYSKNYGYAGDSVDILGEKFFLKKNNVR